MSFSWLRADHATERSNLTKGDKYKILVPIEFGGGFIEDTYFDYGYVFYGTGRDANVYGILAYWNKCEGMEYDGEGYPSTMKDILERGKTCADRNISNAIDIACYDEQINRLKYPLKLVSLEYEGTYEECDGISYPDPYKGFCACYWDGRERNKQ